VFESVRSEDAAARFRSAAFAPLAAFLIALLYFSLYPLLERVPPFLFWTVVLVLFAGVVVGAVAMIREARRERPRGRALAWLIGAVAVELLCARTFLALTFPWL
jgi:uncharacterized membrane protein